VLSNLVRWLPRMSAARIVDLGAGLRPLSCDGLPFVGAAGLEGLYLSGGHGRDGILQSPLAAELIAGLLEDGRASGLERLAAHCAPTGRLA